MQLIKCNLDSLVELRQLSLKTFKDSYEHLNDPIQFNKYLDKAFSISKLSDELINPDSFFYFLSNGGKNVGYLKLNIGNAQTEYSRPDYLEIERIYILKEQQGNGYGKLLIEKSEDVAKELKKEKLWLGVFKLNPKAIEFYKHVGFKEVGIHIFTMGTEEQIDIVMEKELK